MADTAITVDEPEIESESRNSNAAQNTQPSGILMTHSHTSQNSNPTLTLGFNFNHMEDPRRIIADNLSTIGEISPLINLSRSVSYNKYIFLLFFS